MIFECHICSVEGNIAYCSAISMSNNEEYDLDIPLDKFNGQSTEPGTMFKLHMDSCEITVFKPEVWTAEEIEESSY